jgi:hypothetical protein
VLRIIVSIVPKTVLPQFVSPSVITFHFLRQFARVRVDIKIIFGVFITIIFIIFLFSEVFFVNIFFLINIFYLFFDFILFSFVTFLWKRWIKTKESYTNEEKSLIENVIPFFLATLCFWRLGWYKSREKWKGK